MKRNTFVQISVNKDDLSDFLHEYLVFIHRITKNRQNLPIDSGNFKLLLTIQIFHF